MKLIFSEKEKETLNKVSNITGVDYVNNMEVNDLFNALEDIVVEYNRKVEELKDFEEDVNENYTRKEIDWYDHYGISRKDFC